jgi:glycosyltransferase involved in cell wall biosynthesis
MGLGQAASPAEEAEALTIYTVFVSYNRLELLQRTIDSYLSTVSGPFVSAMVVDNGSDPDTLEWLHDKCPFLVVYLGANRYPGYATNIGFDHAPRDTTFLHRSDNDMEYLPGWVEAARERFGDDRVGQVGLRTDEEELGCDTNVGGTSIFRRKLWDQGLRYRTDPWEKLGSMTEDYWISRQVEHMGWKWTRVTRPCVVHIASGDMDDPYYQRSYGIRGIA